MIINVRQKKHFEPTEARWKEAFEIRAFGRTHKEVEFIKDHT
jgi:hypothetical protein